MPAQLENNPDTAMHRRRQPIWPWLLMPLATLAVYLALHNARQTPAHTQAPVAEPAETPAAR